MRASFGRFHQSATHRINQAEKTLATDTGHKTGGDPSGSRIPIRVGAVLVILFGIALTLRLDSALNTSVEDNDQYLVLAKSIGEHGRMLSNLDLTDSDLLRKPPVLPYAIFLLGGRDPFLIFQAIISALLVFPIFFLGAHWATQKSALVAATLWVFWGPAVKLAGVITPETLFLLPMTLGLLALSKNDETPSPGLGLCAGLLLSLAELTRPILLPFVCMVFILYAWRLAKEKYRRGKTALIFALLVAGFALPILAYQVANKDAGFAYVYDRKGITVLTNLVEDGETFQYIHKIKPPDWNNWTDAQRENFALREFADKVSEAPIRFLRSAVKRIGYFWIHGFGDWDGISKWLLRPSPVLTILALIGFIALMFKNRSAFKISAFLIVDFSLMAALVLAKPRFREVATPWLLILASYGVLATLSRLWRSIEDRRSE
jgi:hypothetical protein